MSSVPYSKMYIIFLDESEKMIRVASVTDDGMKYSETGEGDNFWSDWSDLMTPGELAERLSAIFGNN